VHSGHRPRASQAWRTGFTTRRHYMGYAYLQVPAPPVPPAPKPTLLQRIASLPLPLRLPLQLVAFLLLGEQPGEVYPPTAPPPPFEPEPLPWIPV
jgi:hypothetical protein